MKDEKLRVVAYMRVNSPSQLGEATLEEQMEVVRTCVICGVVVDDLYRSSCDPYPVKKSGRCCKRCDRRVVTPARMKLAGVEMTKEQILAMEKTEKQVSKKFRCNGIITKEPTKEEWIAYAKRRFLEGARVMLGLMNDPYTKLKAGDKGTVQFVDDAGGIHIRWDNGEGLAAILPEDLVIPI